MENFEFLCRVCAKLKCQDSKNLFQQPDDDILHGIEELTGMALKNKKFLPQYICQKCLKDMKLAREFRSRCIQAQEYFTTPEYKKAVKLTEEIKVEITPRRRGRKRKTTTVKTEENTAGDEENLETEFQREDLIVNQYEYNLSKKSGETSSLKEEPITITESEFIEEEMHLSTYGEHEITPENCDAMELHIMKLEDEHEYEPEEEELKNFDYEEDMLDELAEEEELTLKTKKPLKRDSNVKWHQTKTKAKSMRKEKRTNDKQTNYVCDQCGNYFTNGNHFRIHLNRHSGKKTHHCEICSAQFYTSSELNRHMRHHTGERPFACRHCDRRFSDYSTRLKHERTHTNERPYCCTQCNKAFTTPYILKNHMLVHTGERHFRCNVCDKSFQRQTHLVVHFSSQFHKQNAEKQQSSKQQAVARSSVQETQKQLQC